jgi:hypothetical protein
MGTGPSDRREGQPQCAIAFAADFVVDFVAAGVAVVAVLVAGIDCCSVDGAPEGWPSAESGHFAVALALFQWNR